MHEVQFPIHDYPNWCANIAIHFIYLHLGLCGWHWLWCSVHCISSAEQECFRCEWQLRQGRDSCGEEGPAVGRGWFRWLTSERSTSCEDQEDGCLQIFGNWKRNRTPITFWDLWISSWNWKGKFEKKNVVLKFGGIQWNEIMVKLFEEKKNCICERRRIAAAAAPEFWMQCAKCF